MPQLDFTLWFINLATNWSILFILFLIFNSQGSLFTPTTNPNPHAPNKNENNENWPW